MRAGRRARWALGCALYLALAAADARAADRPGLDVRVLSGPAPTTTVTLVADPQAQIEDRTPGAQPAVGPRGPVSAGRTFTGELTLFLRDVRTARETLVEVNDPVVSAVRVLPEAAGTTVVVFIRQPVTYTVSRPSPLGEVRIELRGRVEPVLAVGRTPQGRVITRRPAEPAGEEVSVDAEELQYDQQNEVLTARGGVTLTRGDLTLTADEVRYDRRNATADARGHVVVSDPEAVTEADAAHLNLEDETGWLEEAETELRPSGYLLRGGRVEKQGGPCYRVENGVFTTCRCGGLERPSWSLAGRRTDVELEGTGVMRGATFRVKDTPVFWFPYLLFPANRSRQTGFLFPRFSYSNRRGFQYEQPFYWAINKSSDATVVLDVETEARIGLAAEYRYVLSRRTRGAFTLAYFNEQIRGVPRGTVDVATEPVDVPEDRFALTGSHTQPFVAKSRFYLDLFAVSDDQFLREIDSFAVAPGRDYAVRTTRFTTSRAGAIRTWRTGLLQAETAYFQDLVDPEDLTLQRLPQLRGEHAVPLLGGRLVGRVGGELTNFQREEGFDGVRADVGPELFLPFNLGRWVHGSVTGQLRETAYHLTDREQVALVVPDVPGALGTFRVAPELERLDTNRTRELAIVSGRVGTEVSRVFSFPHFGFEKLRHTIEPEVRYLYVPPVNRPVSDVRLPSCASLPAARRRPFENCDAVLFAEGYLFDEQDAINRRNFLSYGLVTRLFGRAPTPPEVAARAEGAPPPPPPRPAVPDDDEGPELEFDDEDEVPAAEADGPRAGPPPPATIDPDTIGPGVVPAAIPPPPSTAPVPRASEMLRASILHGWDPSRPIVGDSHASDVDLGIRFTPLHYLGLAYNATVNFEGRGVRGQSAGVVLSEPGWRPPDIARSLQHPTTVTVGYILTEENVNQGIRPGVFDELAFRTAGVENVFGSVYLRLGNYVGFTFIARYDLNTVPDPEGPGEIGPHFLERDYLFRLISRCNCWVLDAGLADRTNPDERLFRVQFTLVGLGSFGRGTAPRSFIGLTPLSGLGYGRRGGLGGGYY
jgi:LPS-assembly protein